MRSPASYLSSTTGLSFAVMALACSALLLATHDYAYAVQDEIGARRDQDPARPTGSGAVDNITLETIDQESAALETNSEIDKELKSAIRNHYQLGRSFLVAAGGMKAETDRFKATAKRAPTERGELEQNNENFDRSPDLPFDSAADPSELPEISQLQDLLRARKSELLLLEEDLKSQTELPSQRQGRLLAIPKLEVTAEARLQEIIEQLSLDAPAGESVISTRARLVELAAEKQKVDAELSMLRYEREAYEATVGMPAIAAELANKQIARKSDEISILENLIVRQKQDDSDQLIRKISSDNESLPELLKPMGQKNLTLATSLAQQTRDLVQYSALKNEADVESRKIEQENATTKSRVSTVGLSNTLGKMLRRDKADVVARRRRFQTLDFSQKMEEAQLNKFLHQDELTELADVEAAIDREVEKLVDDPAQRQILRGPIADLVQQRKSILQRAIDIESEVYQNLFGLKVAQTEFLQKSQAYTDYIDQHILWLPSAALIGTEDGPGLKSATAWLSSLENWKAAGASIFASASQQLPVLAIMLAGVLGMLFFQPRIRADLKAAGALACKRGCRVFSPTLSATFQTVLIAATLPAIALVIGWLLRESPSINAFARVMGRALTHTAMAAVPFMLLKAVSREGGLAECHFEWSDSFRRTLRWNLRWILPLGIPLLFLAIAMEMADDESFNSLGRIAVLTILVMSAVFCYQLFRPSAATYRSSSPSEKGSYFYRLRHLRYVIIMSGHAFLILFAVLGYYYSVFVIGRSMLQTVALAIGMVIINALAMRFLLVRRRNVRYQQLIQQREAAREAARKAAEELAESGQEPEGIVDSLEIELQAEPGIDITDVSRQARELTNVILLIITGLILLGLWQYLLPATRIMDGWKLWDVTIGSEVKTVTLRDVVFSLIVFAMTYFGVRNMPGMLELLLLQRLPMDAGARYAVTSIFRYVLLVVGVIFALGYLKIPWSKYSWLVAAISVGLGFGLQEIVANFVSGLILLLERPVRVGDVVTIDGTTGVVSRIQMRATTVTNWDNQELVVPNKDLISEKVMNWTLTSAINRIQLTFGVAYGTDTELVRQLITEVVEKTPDILKEPKPLVTFDEFGDSSLNFVVRICTRSVERRWIIISDVNTGINIALKKAGIEIPFPQRDVHMIPVDPK